jgi:CRP-like cAMP-binding protein
MTRKPTWPFVEHRTCLNLTRLTLDALPGDRLLGKSRRFRKNADLWLPEHRADRIYFLESGVVEIFSTDLRGNELVLQVVRPNDAFGELCVCAQGQGLRNTTARASTSVAANEVTYDVFVRYLRAEAGVLTSLLNTFCLRLSDCESRAEVLAQRGADERLGRLLLQLAAGSSARPDRLPGHVALSLTHVDIARMSAMSRPHVTVTLGKFRRLRVIEYGRGRPISVNLPALTTHLESIAGRDDRAPRRRTRGAAR